MGLVAQVERDLAEQWRGESDEKNTVARACVHNLIVVCESADDDVTPVLAQVSRTAPGRAIVIRPVDTDAGLSAYVSANCHKGAAGKIVCSEQIVLEAGRKGMPLLPASVLQLLVEEMPVFTWWRPATLEPYDLLQGLGELTDCMLVDGARFAERPVELLKRLNGWQGKAADLTWSRVDPWRETIAALFDPPRMREALGEIRRLRIQVGGAPGAGGVTVAGAYLAGWIASRLGWTESSGVRIELERDEEFEAGRVGFVSLETDAKTFVVQRPDQHKRKLVSTIETEESCPLPRTIPLPDRDDVAFLCEALQQPARDPLFTSALSAAVEILERS